MESTGDINEPGYQGKKTTKYILIQETAYPEKTTACRKSLTNLSHNVVGVHLTMNGVGAHNFSGGRHKSNYHMITTTPYDLCIAN